MSRQIRYIYIAFTSTATLSQDLQNFVFANSLVCLLISMVLTQSGELNCCKFTLPTSPAAKFQQRCQRRRERKLTWGGPLRGMAEFAHALYSDPSLWLSGPICHLAPLCFGFYWLSLYNRKRIGLNKKRNFEVDETWTLWFYVTFTGSLWKCLVSVSIFDRLPYRNRVGHGKTWYFK